jgi:predicted signal transduction protein with EAL and GGDEF domain
VLTRGLDGPELEDLAEQLRAALAGPLDADGVGVSTRSSIGVAQATADDRAPDLLGRADAALRAAKAGGRGRLVYYEPRMKARLLDQAALLDGLHEAITGGQLELVYQPVVRLDDGALTGLEALARWRHPVRGPIMPGEFIPIAERSGLIVPLGRWMLAEVCREQGTDWPVTWASSRWRRRWRARPRPSACTSWATGRAWASTSRSPSRRPRFRCS